MKKSIGASETIFPNPVFIICTYDDEGKANAMNVAWAGVMCGEPSCIGIAVRPSRYTFDNLKKRKAFTINIPSVDLMEEADYFGIESGRDADKIERAGLTAEKAEFVDAPYIKEFPYIMECEITDSVEMNSHTLFIGEVKDIKADEDILTDKNKPDWGKLQPLTYDYTTNDYRLPGEIAGKAFSAGLKYK